MKMTTQQILTKAMVGQGLEKEEALALLNNVSVQGEEFDKLLNVADQLTRLQFNNMGEVHAQIGLNWGKCSNNCQFCTFSEELGNVKKDFEIPYEDILNRAKEFKLLKVGSISLMATADYSFEDYVKMGKKLHKDLDKEMPLFANWGDITLEQAKELRDAGFAYYYHALRLGEGNVTKILPETRIQTIKNAHEAGLLVGSCLEPIGPEHTYEEMMDILEILKDNNVSWMATMKRNKVENSPLNVHGEITDEEFAKITAVTRIYFGNKLFTMAAHEPKEICLRAGANFLVAETGTNPRDGEHETSENRGLSVEDCRNFLKSSGYEVYEADVDERYLQMSVKQRNYDHTSQLLKNCMCK